MRIISRHKSFGEALDAMFAHPSDATTVPTTPFEGEWWLVVDPDAVEQWEREQASLARANWTGPDLEDES